jgi:hypothetical protein
VNRRRILHAAARQLRALDACVRRAELESISKEEPPRDIAVPGELLPTAAMVGAPAKDGDGAQARATGAVRPRNEDKPVNTPGCPQGGGRRPHASGGKEREDVRSFSEQACVHRSGMFRALARSEVS